MASRISLPPRRPEPRESKVGLSLVDILYGFVLTRVFVATVNGYSTITAVGWAHLVVAAWTIVLSWVGYHNSRLHASVLWKLEFVQLPFFQYLIDVLIAITYWGLVITAEGVPSIPGGGTETALYQPSARPESLLLTAVFLLYYLWDTLEIRLAEKPEYAREAQRAADEEGIDPEGVPPSGLAPRRWWSRAGRWSKLGDRPYYAWQARPMRLVTGTFLAVVGSIAVVVWVTDPRCASTLIMIDALYFVLLFVFRVAQRLAVMNAFEPASGTKAA